MSIRLLTAVLWTSVFAFVAVLLPLPSRAFSGELVSITPEPLQDVSDMVGDVPENILVYAWLLEEGTDYTVVASVSEEPAVVITPGGDISLDTPWSYDADAGTVTVMFTATGLKQVGNDTGPDNAGLLAIVPPVPMGEDGPPAEMTGTWMATNVQEWELIPPSEESISFGFSLTGPAGETGFFHMFMPDAIIELMSEYSGQELTVQDLAVFNGDNQSSMSITEVDGGAYIDINVTFSSTTISATAKGDNGGVTKEITVREQLPVSIAAAKTSVKEGKDARLFGWVKNGKKGQKVQVWRKQEGESEFTKWETAKIKKGGAYELEFTPEATATYRVKYRRNGKVKQSSVQTITVTD